MAEEAPVQEEKKKGVGVGTLVTAIAASILLFSIFVGLSGCWQSIDFSDIAANGLQGLARNACQLGFLTFGLHVAGWFVGLAGTLFDYTLLVTVVSMSALIGKGSAFAGGISLAWSIIRDFANLAFIGAMVYAAIALILKIANVNAGQLIVRILIAALLINFSYFFAGVIIDASNFISLKIYEEGIYSGERVPLSKLNPLNARSGSFGAAGAVAPVSERFMAVTRLGSLYDISKADFEVGGQFDGNTAFPYIIAGMGAFMFALTAGVFLTAAIFLIIRFVIILLLLITSPIGILYLISPIPLFSSWGKAWWGTLIAQALFPIVFLVLIATSFKVAELGFATSIAGDKSLFGLITNPSDLEAWYTNLNLVFVYIVMWLMMFLSLRAASNVAQQKAFTPPTPAQLFAGAQPIGENIAKALYPRGAAFKAARWVVGGLPGKTGDEIKRTLKYGTGTDLAIGAGKAVGRLFSPKARATQAAEARRTNRILDALLRAQSNDPTTAREGRKALKDEFENMKEAERAKRYNGMNANEKAVLEDALPEEMMDKIKKDAKGVGKISSAAKAVPVQGGGSSTKTSASAPQNIEAAVSAIRASDSHEAIRDDRELNRFILNAARDKRSAQTLVAEMRRANVSLAKLPAQILTQPHVAAQLTVRDLAEIGLHKEISFNEYQEIIRKAPRDVRKRFLSGPGKYARSPGAFRDYLKETDAAEAADDQPADEQQ